jgi:LmbE family N-acetylglucosaminyl deacetylase
VSRVLVVAPHPDDEAFGCGGAIAGHARAGDDVRAIFLTSGEAGGHGSPADDTAPRREREARAAAEILGIKAVDFWRLPDGRVRAGQDMVERLRAELRRWRPTRVYVTHAREQHSDHRAAARAVERALSGFGRPPEVWRYEVWTPITRIDALVDISDHIDVKLAALRAHASQCAVLRFDESALGLARYRGEMHSWPGGPYAEAFEMRRA